MAMSHARLHTHRPIIDSSPHLSAHRWVFTPLRPQVCPHTFFFLHRFDGSEESAVRLANDSKYGLTASIYGKDVERAGRVAAAIAAGQ
eukprot:scaffold25702_cov51-Isochrysis_galbana.AAC.1